MGKLIITVAPTGNVPTVEKVPSLPLSPAEIAEDIFSCYQAGAAIAHIHARGQDGLPTADPEIFSEIAERVKEKCDIIIQFSTGARAGKSAAERGACIDKNPEMASLTTGSSNFADSVNYNSPELIKELALRMKQQGVKPEIEVFDLSALEYANHLVKQGLLQAPLHINLVLGVPGSISGTPRNLFFLLENLPPASTWTVTSIGKSHNQLSALAIVLGGHVRTGLEDVIELEKGQPISNPQLVNRLTDIARVYDRDMATPKEARKLLGLKNIEYNLGPR